MAKLKMKKIEILASIHDVKSIVDLIQRKGIIELYDSPDDDALQKIPASQSFGFYDKYMNEASEALKVLDKYCPESKNLVASFFPEKQNLSLSEFTEYANSASEFLSTCMDINQAEKQINDSSSGIARYEALLKSLEPWLSLDIPMKYQGTKSVSTFIGSMPGEYSADSLKNALLPLVGDEERFEIEVVSSAKTQTDLCVFCHNECKQLVFDSLRSLGFSYPSDPTKHPPKVRYERYKKAIEDLKKKSEEALETIKSLADKRADIKFAYDYFSLYKEKYSTIGSLAMTDNIFVLYGYIAEKDIEKFAKELNEKYTVAINIMDPDEDEDVPVKLQNNKFTAAVEGITNMYSPPGKDDIDPNPIMAFFYYALFGIMLSDAGYGLLMVIGTLIAKTKFKLEGAMKKTVDMYFYCGIATVFWGALFGSWFGDIVTRVAYEFFNYRIVLPWIDPSTVGEMGSVALWFEPVNDPMKLMLFSFLFGIIHLFVGVGCNFFKMWKLGNKVGALCDCVPVWLLITGVAPLGANIFQPGTFGTNVTSVMKWLAIAGAVLIVATSGRDSKNIVGKLGLGLYGLYNTASGWLGDILSYSRLLALGLCTGVIATVVNTIGTIPENLAVKAIMLVPVFIFGHAVNLAINVIGTYVHTNRLQYVEFFAKFYEGGGRSFTPLKINSKYYNIKED